ncbi:histone-lysine N-methyltransferase 2A [Pieris rapae]|uniref:histone-lysine N-methyltransferase 2A n=1 Tax=Pieris rapae TaxID=64459 RepID=UPI001E27F57E|nr:histone-lysine N-methyltransferase 2A [Pieris rapae]XP_022120285.2 histone-lysine N-methyltransferase 2A [Pieris rapae]
MSEIKYKNQILAAIDHLRARKSRPDIGRICKFMLKCYKVAPKDTKADLKRCIKEKSIYKVDYKDNVSYRNAAKWRKKSTQNNTMSLTVATSERRIITSAIATLIYQDQSYLENGIAFDELVKVAALQDPKYTKKQLEAIINKELSSGSLVKLSNGALALGPADHDGDSSDSFKFDYNDSNTKMTSSANSSCRSSPQRTRGRPRKRPGQVTSSQNSNHNQNSVVRVGERRKMAKKVFDPSDNNVPSKRKRGRPVGSLNKSTIKKRMMIAGKVDKEGTPLSESQPSIDGSGDERDRDETHLTETDTSGGVCSVCLVEKSQGNSDLLVECRDCNNKAHLSCLQSGSGILKPRPDNTWQCPHCKTCAVCCETNDAGILTVCSICSDAYHALCHSPRIPERLKAWDQWECTNCLESRPSIDKTAQIIQNNIEFGTKNSSAIDPFLKPHEIDRAAAKIADKVPIDPSIPDITNWNVDDVYDYFMEHLSEAAPILRDQEFDGQAISMARRADIVRGLGLPLGPALALYRIIVKLQTRKDDWRMCWG